MESQEIFPQQARFLTRLEKLGKSANSLKSYRLDFECFNDFIDKKVKSKNLSFNTETVREFEHYLEQKYPSINSRRRKLQTLRLFFDYLVEKGLYPENPIKKIASAPKSLLPPMPTLYPELFQCSNYLTKQFKNSNTDFESIVALRNTLLFTLVYEAGISVAPLSKLKEEDIILTENSIRVMLSPPKRDPYSIPINPVHMELFKTYLAEKPDFKELFFFANNYKIVRGGISPRGVEDIFQKISKQIDISMTPKSLRQSCIIKWILAGEPDSSIKEWLGLAPSYSLALYKKYIQDQREQKTDQLDYKSLQIL